MEPIVSRRAWKLNIIVTIIFALFIIVISCSLVSCGDRASNVTSKNTEKMLVIPEIKVVQTPDPGSLKPVKINQSIKVTVTLSAENNQSVLSQLQGGFGSTSSSLQQLLGNHNIACASAYLDADPDQFNVAPPQAREYPLNQQSIMWSWIVTPKQAGTGFFNISFVATGKSTCTENNNPIVGPYLLSQPISYAFTISDPNSSAPLTPNIFVQIFNDLGIGTIISGALTTLLALLLTWILIQQWERRKNNKNTSADAQMPIKLD
jgi:hypothetical protein